MQPIHQLYRPSLALLTDFYQLTMSYGYWKSQSSNKEAVFNLFFRKPPFEGGFTIACGLTYVIDYLQNFHVEEEDVAYLSTLTGTDGKPLFERAYLDYLRKLEFTCDIDAVPEGSVVFPQEPILRVQGPIIQCQLLESALLNIINFQTLIATKAARIRLAAGDRPVVEFGLRRAHGIDGALTASWASFIGGCDGTSNVLAGRLLDIPVKGTHAHSWVMSFDSELEAFQTYAETLPNNCLFLVDTYDTIAGVNNAIKVGKWLKEHNHKLIGIRLDSGDLADLSIRARKMLDDAGFADATIFATNDLDEHIISSLNAQGSQIGAWGVGTKLITAFDQPAIGGVYKLSAVRLPGQSWSYRIKLSEQPIKVSNPGIQQVRRFLRDSEYWADAIFDLETKPGDSDFVIVDPLDVTLRRVIPTSTKYVDLLQPVFRGGKLIAEQPTVHEIKKHVSVELGRFPAGIKRLLNPHKFPVGLELGLHEMKTGLIMKIRGVPTS